MKKTSSPTKRPRRTLPLAEHIEWNVRIATYQFTPTAAEQQRAGSGKHSVIA